MVFNSELFCQLVKTQKLYWIKAYLEPLLHKSQIFFLHEEDRHSVECFTISFIQLITKATDCLMRGSAFFKEHKGLSLLEFSNKKMLIGEFIHCTQVASPEVLAYLVYKCQFTWAKMIVKNYNAVLNHEQKREFRIILETFLFQESSPYFLYQSDNCFFEVAECFLRVNSFFVPSRTVFQNSRKALCVCNNVSEFFLQKQDSFQRFINLSIFA